MQRTRSVKFVFPVIKSYSQYIHVHVAFSHLVQCCALVQPLKRGSHRVSHPAARINVFHSNSFVFCMLSGFMERRTKTAGKDTVVCSKYFKVRQVLLL